MSVFLLQQRRRRRRGSRRRGPQPRAKGGLPPAKEGEVPCGCFAAAAVPRGGAQGVFVRGLGGVLFGLEGGKEGRGGEGEGRERR